MKLAAVLITAPPRRPLTWTRVEKDREQKEPREGLFRRTLLRVTTVNHRGLRDWQQGERTQHREDEWVHRSRMTVTFQKSLLTPPGLSHFPVKGDFCSGKRFTSLNCATLHIYDPAKKKIHILLTLGLFCLCILFIFDISCVYAFITFTDVSILIVLFACVTWQTTLMWD